VKTTTVNSIKFLKLKRRLGLPHWQAVGILESIWLFCMVNAQDGGIGRHSNEDIAAAIEWDGDADQLIKHLVDTGWLDCHPEVRLCVHDWDQHAPNFIRAVISKQGKKFCTVVDNQGSQPEKPTKVGNQSRQSPILTKPIQSKPSQKESHSCGENSPQEDADEAAELTRLWKFHRRGVCGSETLEGVLQHFGEALKFGLDFKRAAHEIENPQRNRTEYLWQFLERMKGKKPTVKNLDEVFNAKNAHDLEALYNGAN
jgi:hypothetical protein